MLFAVMLILSLSVSNIIEMRGQWKEEFQKRHGVKLGFMSPFVKAACHALLDQPIVNAGGCGYHTH